jgi:hypothetical protein
VARWACSVYHLADLHLERYTETQRSQHLTQSDPRVFGEYVANCSSVAGMRAFLDEEADHREVEYFQGLEQSQSATGFKTTPFSVNSSKGQEKLTQQMEWLGGPFGVQPVGKGDVKDYVWKSTDGSAFESRVSTGEGRPVGKVS